MAVKRKTASSSGSAKRQKQCTAIKEALLQTESFPLRVRQMVSGNLQDCLCVAKEERHQVQEEVIDMIGQILKSTQDAFQKRIEEAEAKLGSANTEKESRVQAKESTAADVVLKTEAQTNQKHAVSVCTETASSAVAALKAAEAEQIGADKERAEAAGRKEKLETVLREAYTPLKDGGLEAEAQKSAIAAVVQLGKDLKLDTSMITSLPSALAKANSDRGTFDSMVLDTLGDELNKRIKQLEDNLANGDAAKADLTAKAEAARNEKAAAEANVTSNREKLDQCNADLHAAKAAHKSAASALSQFDTDMKSVKKDLETAQAEFATFRDGALAGYEELLTFTKVQPVEAVAEGGAEA